MDSSDLVSIIAAVLHGPVGVPGSDLPGKAELCADRAWEIYYAVRRAAAEATRRQGNPARFDEEESRVISQEEF